MSKDIRINNFTFGGSTLFPDLQEIYHFPKMKALIFLIEEKTEILRYLENLQLPLFKTIPFVVSKPFPYFSNSLGIFNYKKVFNPFL